MPRKHATNAAGHEIPPVASNRPAPTAATSSNTNVARKKPAAFANGIHSATADGASGRASVISRNLVVLVLLLVLVLERNERTIEGEDEDEEEWSRIRQVSLFP